jgi:hypothetical protein
MDPWSARMIAQHERRNDTPEGFGPDEADDAELSRRVRRVAAKLWPEKLVRPVRQAATPGPWSIRFAVRDLDGLEGELCRIAAENPKVDRAEKLEIHARLVPLRWEYEITIMADLTRDFLI